MVSGHSIVAQSLTELVSDPLGLAASADEDQGSAMGLDLLDDVLVGGRPNLVGRDRSQLAQKH